MSEPPHFAPEEVASVGPPADFYDWRNSDDPPWESSERGLSAEEDQEIELFQKQHVFKLERDRRREEYERKLRQLKAEYNALEDLSYNDIYYPFASRVWFQGIRQTRQTVVPAYTLDRFQELPTELRWRIWSFASRTDQAKITNIYGMDSSETSTYFYGYSRQQERAGSSRVAVAESNYTDRTTIPSILHTCHESRLIAQRVYTLMAVHSYIGEQRREMYFNTLYDWYYMGGIHGEIWTNFKILVDLFIQHNTTRPLQQQVQNDVANLRNIRFLILDFNVFATAPARIWADFPKLEKIVIAVYPHDTISDWEPRRTELYRRFERIDPPEGSKYAKRISWLQEYAARTLNRVKTDEFPLWVVPELEITIRATGHDIDDQVYDPSLSAEPENEDDDSLWYTQAEAKMKHSISKKQLSLLKQKHHPSRQITRPENHPGKKFGDWVEDSETEDGHEYRPHIGEDEL